MPLNSITYKEVFKHIKDNNLWLGYGFNAGNAYFAIDPLESKNFAKGVYDEKTGLVKFRNVTWGTNLDIKKRHELIDTIYTYEKHKDKYPKYDNYDAINVDKVAEIPMDYNGVMGVPITFLDKHNPKQFEIVGLLASCGYNKEVVNMPLLISGDARGLVDGKVKYARILIRKTKTTKE